jgi:EAL domain-containing protein (putative c-di-GMP-specific phosphodiesterase class I)
MGCSHGQGYLFSPPIDASGVDRLLGLRTEPAVTSRVSVNAVA